MDTTNRTTQQPEGKLFLTESRDAKNQELHVWRITEPAYDPESAAHYASLFSLANGYIGLRASQEDLPIPPGQASDGVRGTFINAFYDTSPIVYGESAYGFADTAETMQNVANPLPLELTVDNVRFDLNQVAADGRLCNYERYLSMESGVLVRVVGFDTRSGGRLEILSKRLVSFAHPNSATMRYEISNTGKIPMQIRLRSYIDTYTKNKTGGADPRLPRGSEKPTLEVTGHGCGPALL